MRRKHEGLSHQHFFSEEDGGYIADIPDLEACSAFGNTPEKALAEVKLAKAAWLKATCRARKPVPRPRYRPVILPSRSIRVTRIESAFI
jgi:predicted RNase H-like HicB family nuclease